MGADALARMSSDSSDSMLLDTIYPPQFSPLLDGRTTKKSKRGVEDLKNRGSTHSSNVLRFAFEEI
jgi:hypothetical protein